MENFTSVFRLFFPCKENECRPKFIGSVFGTPGSKNSGRDHLSCTGFPLI